MVFVMENTYFYGRWQDNLGVFFVTSMYSGVILFLFLFFPHKDPAVVSAAVEAKMQHVMVSRVGVDLIQYLPCVLFAMSTYLQIWVSERDQNVKKWIGSLAN